MVAIRHKGSGMRISLMMGPRERPDLDEPVPAAWRDFIGDALRAEELGFDSVFIGEHHFTYAAGTGAPLIMGAAIAARTERIRIGMSVLCLPFHNPLRLAEDIAGVDIVSGGRFDLGIGVGSQYEEFDSFGIPSTERVGRTWEAIDVIERCLGGEEEFHHKGRYFDFPNVRFILRPVQDRIPVWWGGFGPQGVRRAAQRGYHLYAPDPAGVYDQALRDSGRNPDDHFVGWGPTISIAPTREQAFDAVADALLFTANIYALRRNLDGSWPPESGRVSPDQLRAANDGAGRLEHPVAALIADTPDGVVERLLPLVRGAAGRMNHLPINFRHPGMRTQDVARSMELFTTEVLPRLRRESEEPTPGGR